MTNEMKLLRVKYKVVTRTSIPVIKFYTNGVPVEKTKHNCIQDFYKYAYHQWVLSSMISYN
jgi:hypothetical protein